MSIWIGASYVLGRDVNRDEPYPHICGRTVDGQMTKGLQVRTQRRDCAACAEAAHLNKSATQATQ